MAHAARLALPIGLDDLAESRAGFNQALGIKKSCSKCNPLPCGPLSG